MTAITNIQGFNENQLLKLQPPLIVDPQSLYASSCIAFANSFAKNFVYKEPHEIQAKFNKAQKELHMHQRIALYYGLMQLIKYPALIAKTEKQSLHEKLLQFESTIHDKFWRTKNAIIAKNLIRGSFYSFALSSMLLFSNTLFKENSSIRIVFKQFEIVTVLGSSAVVGGLMLFNNSNKSFKSNVQTD